MAKSNQDDSKQVKFVHSLDDLNKEEAKRIREENERMAKQYEAMGLKALAEVLRSE